MIGSSSGILHLACRDGPSRRADQSGDEDRDPRRDDQSSAQREPVLGDQGGKADDAGTCRNEEQPEVVDERAGDARELLVRSATQAKPREEEQHADEGAWEREAEAVGDGVAGKLKCHQNAQLLQHLSPRALTGRSISSRDAQARGWLERDVGKTVALLEARV